jgi:GNAT superfamily N-acetyltransferase
MRNAELGTKAKIAGKFEDDETTMSRTTHPRMSFRLATARDAGRLAEWNFQLIRDEGHRNPMNVAQLEERMRGWLKGEYRAVIFAVKGEEVAYALYREGAEEVYLRQLFVARERRREGIGKKVVEILRRKIWPKGKRLTVAVLTKNPGVIKFYRAAGYADYSLEMEIVPGEAKRS